MMSGINKKKSKQKVVFSWLFGEGSANTVSVRELESLGVKRKERGREEGERERERPRETSN